MGGFVVGMFKQSATAYFGGGETDFRDFKISPQKGTAVLFVHDTWHEGAQVTYGVKYIARSDVLYR